jgi:hypothetical protein
MFERKIHMEPSLKNTSAGSRGRGAWLIVGVLIGIVVLLIGFQQYQSMSTQSTYDSRARRLIDDMYATMVLAEDINTARYDVIFRSLYHENEKSIVNFGFANTWMRVARIDPNAVVRNPDAVYEAYLRDGDVFVSPAKALENLQNDSAYRTKIETMRGQAAGIAKAIRALQPTDKASDSYQKMIRTYAYFEQYIEHTLVPPNSALLGSSTLLEAANQYMHLHRELRIELP